ncbi:MAG: hypothetical protein Q4G25_09190 [Paracoccus sp. (in: a-proteobacteria)]|nr:hypothetical protein [Paracoccus sp. (in: a-proteobacteria)]
MRPGRINLLPIWVGAGLTFLVLSGVILAGLSSVCDAGGVCTPRWRLLANAPAHELGDTLSGVGSVLAFIWVIVTVWMQSIQLQLQRRDIHAQQAESRRLSDAMEAQAKIYQQEQDERAQDRAGKEMEALIDRFLTSASYLRAWGRDGLLLDGMAGHEDEDARFEAALDLLILRGQEALAYLARGMAMQRLNPDDARQAALYLGEINAIQPRLSRAERIWLTKFELAQAGQVLNDLLAQPMLWTEKTEEP